MRFYRRHRWPLAKRHAGSGQLSPGLLRHNPVGGSSSNGTVFSLEHIIKPTMNYWQFTTLFSFTGGGDGAVPRGGMVFGTDVRLYGTTSLGGDNGDGTIFRINPDNGVLNTSSSCKPNCNTNGGREGYQPRATLIQGDPTAISTAPRPTAVITALALFSCQHAGRGLRVGVQHNLAVRWHQWLPPVWRGIQGRLGNLYGSTYGGGTSSNGTVYTLFVPS